MRGLYVITGGLGAIGTEIANLLLTHYNARLILTGRTELSQNPDKMNALNRLKKAGSGEVQYHAIDQCHIVPHKNQTYEENHTSQVVVNYSKN